MNKIEIRTLTENGEKALQQAKEEVFIQKKFLKQFIVSYSLNTVVLEWKNPILDKAKNMGFDMSGFLIERSKKIIENDLKGRGAIIDIDYKLTVLE